MDDQIIQHRMARGIIVEGASGILPSEWTDVLGRVDTLEGVAETTNPTMPPVGAYISTVSHGLGGLVMSGNINPLDALFTPIFVPEGFTTEWLGVEVTTPQAGASLNVGLYNRSRALVDYVNVSATTAGVKLGQFSSPVTVNAGLHWLGVHCNNTSDVQINVHHDGLALYYDPTNWTHLRALRGNTAFGAMPPMSVVTTLWGSAPLLFLEVST